MLLFRSDGGYLFRCREVVLGFSCLFHTRGLYTTDRQCKGKI